MTVRPGPAVQQEDGARPANQCGVERLADELDDVLTTLPYVRGNEALTDRLFEQVVDLLVESVILDLRRQYEDGLMSARTYAVELATFAAQARAVGLGTA